MIEIRHEQITDTISTQDAYNRIYRDQGLMQRDSFYLWLIELLKPQPGKYLADISCGEGRLTALARERGLHALGVDFAFEGSPDWFEGFARLRLGRWRWRSVTAGGIFSGLRDPYRQL